MPDIQALLKKPAEELTDADLAAILLEAKRLNRKAYLAAWGTWGAAVLSTVIAAFVILPKVAPALATPALGNGFSLTQFGILALGGAAAGWLFLRRAAR